MFLFFVGLIVFMCMSFKIVCVSTAPSSFTDDGPLEEYIMEYKMRYHKQLFASMEPDMDPTKMSSEQVDIQHAAKRVVWRYNGVLINPHFIHQFFNALLVCK